MRNSVFTLQGINMHRIEKKTMQELIKIAKDFKVKELYLFGSILRDDFNSNSDVDIMVSFPDGLNLTLFDLALMREKLEEIFNRKVDLVEKKALLNPSRRDEIFNTARRIYAS